MLRRLWSLVLARFGMNSMSTGNNQGLLRESSLPFLRGRAKKLPLVDNKGRLNVETHGSPKTYLYWGDLFHTLVNMPNTRFMVVLVCTYTVLFGGFAIPFYYDAHNNLCIPGVQTFSHAVWFSVQTSMTIGYGGDLTPDPRCMMTNVMVVAQSLFSLLVAYSLLGVFYMRFARPARRAQTLIFSKFMVLHEEDGVPVLAFRVANIRKHQIIEANVRVLVGLNNHLTDEDESVFHFTALPVVGGSQVFLGLPFTVKHPLTSTSPLCGLTIEEMEEADVELLVLLEGVDASTSSKLQARHSYRPTDIRNNYRFETMVARTLGGRRRVDFTKFNSVVPVTAPLSTRPAGSVPPSPAPSAMRLPGLGIFSQSAYSLEPAPQLLPRRNLPGTENCNTSDSDSNASAAEAYDEALDTIGGLPVPEKPANQEIMYNRHKKFMMARSMPDLFDSNIMKAGPELRSKEQDLEHRVVVAEARAQAWKQMVIELASGIQQTLQQPTSAAHADSGPLIANARQALMVALATN